MMEETFRITNDKSADWALQQIAEAMSERDRLVLLAQEQIADLQNRIEELNAKYDRDTSFLKGCLAEYFSTVPHKDTKTQESYKLLSGSLVMKKASAKIVKDDDALLAYLEHTGHNDFIKVKKSVDWAEFKKTLRIMDNDVIDEDGVVVEGCSIEDVPQSFDVKFF